MTTDQLLSALNDAFTAAGIDTPEKVGPFIRIAALQVKKNSQEFELQKLTQTQAAVMQSNQTAREAKQAEIAQTGNDLIALIAGQSA